jgi:hypothetical protein
MMLTEIGYHGVYRDENISVSLLLENPLRYGLASGVLLFSVAIRPRDSVIDGFGDDTLSCINNVIDGGNEYGVSIMSLNDFTFYLMDEHNHMHNVQSVPHSALSAVVKSGIAEDTQSLELATRGFIKADFKCEFLYQSMRVAFYYEPYERIEVVGLRY